MRKVYLSAGHSNKKGRDRGAVSGNNVEGVLTVEFRALLYKELMDLGIEPIIDKDDSILSETINFFKSKINKDSIVIDIHFNSAISTKATGTEVLVPNEPSNIELTLSSEIAKSISDIMGIQLRGKFKGYAGVKSELESHHGRLGWMRLTGENILIEICFISNPSEILLYHRKKEEIAKSVAKNIAKYVIDNKPINIGITHKVVKGDSLWKISTKYGVGVDTIKKNNNLKSDIITVGQVLKIK